MPDCLTPDCRRLARLRGLCRSCYARRSREIDAGQWGGEWIGLIAQGLARAAEANAQRDQRMRKQCGLQRKRQLNTEQ